MELVEVVVVVDVRLLAFHVGESLEVVDVVQLQFSWGLLELESL